MYFIVVTLIVILTLSCFSYMVYKVATHQDKETTLSFWQAIMLAFSGVIAFIGDTIGVGSFAINIAIAKTFKLVKDADLPALANGAQVVPGAIEAVFFLGVLHVDALTLITLVLGATLGGFIGGIYASKIDAKKIRLIMISSFVVVIFLLLTNLLGLIPIGGSLVALAGTKLVLGFFGMFIAGFLVCFGVGLFAIVQAILFLLGMSPLVAFPIMTTAGAIQQPVTTFAFIFAGRIPLKKILIVGLFGIVGVMIGFNIVTSLTTFQLHCLLILVIGYNVINLVIASLKDSKTSI
ncbi:sulfite exporter TauE/SafE family protein [Francisella adeliensis]|uniref:Sulfite exporter TauE/SafE family protein n=2 Tax=Francisella adeliensis TaxID=2007306 RepID=A0ABX6KE61_9GAMM|nr:sulfite exporter TauE/SafE family protein [Francisella adeliensis]MBK2086467.1 sulfite exporter TauE/SafE family protein [Francisella adeliensis]MBK2096095.1 sulfite exporter TauE/SafE family protein [Francisella adeliensis]QIW12623.1 sulfite exporter TauE/SafE family protein [Francisella adeliensis]QIW14497.1 sulfite exporter TauE/SafE family protein [Francisella adeliensis]